MAEIYAPFLDDIALGQYPTDATSTLWALPALSGEILAPIDR